MILILLGIFLVAGLMIFIDQPFALVMETTPFDHLRYWSREITNIGLGNHWYVLSGGLFIFCKWIAPKQKSWSPATQARVLEYQRWSLHCLAALTATGLTLQMSKHIIGRERPHVTPAHLPLEFSPFTGDWYWHSMPSGHAQVLGCVAACLVLWRPKLKALWFGLFLLLALTRAIILQHFLSDVGVGFTLGYFGAQLCFQWLSRKVPRPRL
jgi:membrane-associated phospholipid phosphatase